MGTFEKFCDASECENAESCALAKCNDDLQKHGILRSVALGQCADDQYTEVLIILDSQQNTLVERQAV
ncbi:MAG TPA: hypothetical protein PKD20_01180 [Candidatus Saccharibacteria bacterium]|nr:hypothetical protein [Candidatus Saccharibacteria bacterium]HMT55469.1 hypothetical protein [Candidatus Saccharibacteria bacterium]